MARQAKAAKATVVEPDEYSFTGDSGPPIDKPPIDNDRLERDCEEIDADVDYEPDFAPEGEGREESDGKPLIICRRLSRLSNSRFCTRAARSFSLR